MKFSADDIANATFERRWRGYDQGQVHEFMLTLAREWEYMSEEVQRLQTEVEEQDIDIQTMRSRERGLLDALNAARDMADEIKERAETQSARILEDASERAEQIIANARREQDELLASIQEIRRQRGRLEHDLRDVLTAHQRILDSLHDPELEAVSGEGLDTIPLVKEDPVIHRRPRNQSSMTDRFPAEPREAEEEERFDTLVGVAPG